MAAHNRGTITLILVVFEGASFSAFWILVANSWMQTPAGIHLENNRVVVDSYFEAIFNKNMPWGVFHMWFACLATSLFVLGGLSAWYILKRRNTDLFLQSFKLALIGANTDALRTSAHPTALPLTRRGRGFSFQPNDFSR